MCQLPEKTVSLRARRPRAELLREHETDAAEHHAGHAAVGVCIGEMS
jgi:hypothetical protein